MAPARGEEVMYRVAATFEADYLRRFGGIVADSAPELEGAR
jgi:aspartyl-tRNA(Asn)/glutamyl-tRNA(Gln) amidotransferase subunit A